MLLATRPDAFLLGGLADAAFAIAFTKTLFEMPATLRGDSAENLPQYLARAANSRFVFAFALPPEPASRSLPIRLRDPQNGQILSIA